MCREPITNPFAIESIEKHIESWLPRRLVGGFYKLNKALNTTTTWEEEEPPVQQICVHCYIKEVYEWVQWRDEELAKKFLSLFSFGYSTESFSNGDSGLETEFEEEESQTGICDDCGEYCDELRSAGGKWLCNGCI